MKDVRLFSRRPEQVVGWLITLLAVLWFAWESRKRFAHHDDAYIAYRYARNLVRGNGLVWNTGERVEGFTSLAWVLLVAAGMRMGFDAPAVSHVLGVLSGSLLLCLTYVYAAARVPERRLWLAALSPWLVWSTTAFGYWSTSGLETPLFCAAVLLALILIEKRRVREAALAAALATLTRPDGVLIFGLVLLCHFSRCNWRSPPSWRLPATCAAFIGLLTLFRLLYFHSPLPNTFYAKVGTIPFFVTSWYSLRFCSEVLAPALLPAALGAAADPLFPLGFAWLAVTFLYVSLVGADVFDHHRFFLPAIPPLLVYATRGASAGWEDSKILSRIALACIPACFAWYLQGPFCGAVALAVLAPLCMAIPKRITGFPRMAALSISALAAAVFARQRLALPSVYRSCFECQMVLRHPASSRTQNLEDMHHENEMGGEMIDTVCTNLAEAIPRVTSIAAGGIGYLGYCSPLRLVDILGLTDSTIAHTPADPANEVWPIPGHQRTNARYVLSRRPDYIFIPKRGSRVLLASAMVDLWRQPDLDRLYSWNDHMQAYELRWRAKVRRYWGYSAS